MNRRQKEMLQVSLNSEKDILKKLSENYQDALAEIETRIAILQMRGDADLQHVIYQVEYQKQLKSQIETIIEQLHNNNFESVSEYLTKCYEQGFIGTLYDIQGQGIPLVFPIDQEMVVAAIQHETQLSTTLYAALGKDTKDLSKKIASEISRGITNNAMYSEIARNLSGYAGISKNNAMRIARTEGHRIQNKAISNAQHHAKDRGADIVKIWEAALDDKTRDTHRMLDGQVRELDEPFEINGMEAMEPGGFGDPAEDINCRCRCNSKARWLLGEAETKYIGNTDKMTDEDLEPIAGKLGISVEALRQYKDEIIPVKAKNYDDFKRQYDQIYNYRNTAEYKAAQARIAGKDNGEDRVLVNAQKMKPTNKFGEEVQFDFKGKDEKHEKQKQIITELSNQYDTRLQRVTIGAKNAAGNIDMSGATMRLNDSNTYTAIHEFAHSLANESANKYGLTHDDDFWKDIKKIRTAYRKDVKDDARRFISSYEHSERKSPLDEFFAEAFTQAKMDEMGLELPSKYGSDLTYSKQVIGVVDKYFRKKK